MIRLHPDQYHLLKEPLEKVAINHCFARSVVERHVSGSIYVNDVNSPATFYIVHPYKMSLLSGQTRDDSFNMTFYEHALNIRKARNYHEWMQAWPDEWHEKLSVIFKGKMIRSQDNANDIHPEKIEINTRVNFFFNREKYEQSAEDIKWHEFSIVRTDKELFNEMNGTVVPKYFWENADQFTEKSIGFSLLFNDEPASTAYAAFIHDNQLEIGIETIEKYRGRGFALYVCSALIDYCLVNDLEPVWSCRLENNASFRLARKLGFEPLLYVPYYRLCR